MTASASVPVARVPRSRRPRGSTAAALAVAGLSLGLVVCVVAALADRPATRERREAGRAVARDLGLTDPALFGEARYTRHPSQADLASAFQDAPASLDHFPAGSLVAPPRGFGTGHVGTGEE